MPPVTVSKGKIQINYSKHYIALNPELEILEKLIHFTVLHNVPKIPEKYEYYLFLCSIL